jgi:CRISPR-associated protein Cas1
VGSGLHPALGIHHSNQYNAFALADDLVEPLRPIVDEIVYGLTRENLVEEPEVDPPNKRALLESLTREVALDKRRYPMMTALGLYSANTRECLVGGAKKLICPGR